jgi:hypothetical protein
MYHNRKANATMKERERHQEKDNASICASYAFVV